MTANRIVMAALRTDARSGNKARCELDCNGLGGLIMRLLTDDYVLLRLLALGSFQRRPRGGWRFGTKVISDRKVARLVASRRAGSDATRVWLIKGSRNRRPA
jgi:hypothetical protein